MVCDTGHNSHGFAVLGPQIASQAGQCKGRFLMVFGVVADKDLDSIVAYLPREAHYYFVKARGSRALPAEVLAERMASYGFRGEAVSGSIGDFLGRLVPGNGAGIAGDEDFIFIGGSTFVVAEAIEYFG